MKKVKLKEILEVKRGTSLSGKYYSDTGDKIRLTLGNFDYPGGGFKENTAKSDIYFTGEVKPQFILKKGDIITPLTEQVSGLLGETAIIPEDNKYIQSGDIGLVIPNPKELDSRFAYYLISSSIIKKQLDVSSQQTKIRHTSPEKIMDCIAWIPELKIQRKIAKFLDFINEKIKNNSKINNNLEELMKTIYQRWFIEFEFPNEEGKPYKSNGGKLVYNHILKRDIPECWKVKNIMEFIRWEGTSQPPKSCFAYEPKEGYIRFIQNRDYEDEEHRTYIPKDKALGTCNKYDILIDKYGDAGKTRFGLEGAYNVALAKINVKDIFYREYIRNVLSSKPVYEYLHNSSMASTRSSLNENNISYINLVVPDNKIIEDFNIYAKNYIEINLKIIEENQRLKSLKEFILPLLMNGQINVDDIEI